MEDVQYCVWMDCHALLGYIPYKKDIKVDRNRCHTHTFPFIIQRQTQHLRLCMDWATENVVKYIISK